MKSECRPKIIGTVTPFYRRIIDGQVVDEQLPAMKNRVVYQGWDLLAKAFAGESVVDGMYFQYTNGMPNETPVPPERMAMYYHTTGSTAPKGFTRVPLLGRPEFVSTDVTRYNGNRITIVAVSDSDTVVLNPGNEIQDNLTKFVGAALVSLADDYANDKLFSAVSFAFEDNVPVYIEKIPNAQIGLRWDITFEDSGTTSSSAASSISTSSAVSSSTSSSSSSNSSSSISSSSSSSSSSSTSSSSSSNSSSSTSSSSSSSSSSSTSSSSSSSSSSSTSSSSSSSSSSSTSSSSSSSSSSSTSSSSSSSFSSTSSSSSSSFSSTSSSSSSSSSSSISSSSNSSSSSSSATTP